MIKALASLFAPKQTPMQRSVFVLTLHALANKNYRIEQNFIEDRHHLLSVKIFLNSHTSISLDNTEDEDKTLFIKTEAGRYMNCPEISSEKTYEIILSHFKGLLEAERQKALSKIKTN